MNAPAHPPACAQQKHVIGDVMSTAEFGSIRDFLAKLACMEM